MKKIIAVILFFLASLLLQVTSIAQAPDTTWTKTFGGNDFDRGYSVQQTFEGGYIIAAHTESFNVTGALWLIKTDDYGDTLWTRIYEEYYINEGFLIKQTNDYGYIITGAKSGYVCLIKTDALGDTLWTKMYGGSGWDAGHSVQQTEDRGYIITSGIFPNNYLWLIKTNEFGDTLWTKILPGIGGSVQQTSDGGYVITGTTTDYDIWLIKTDSVGNPLWSKAFGTSDIDYGFSVRQTEDGGFIITGITDITYPAGCYTWLIKTDSVGNSVWIKTFGDLDKTYMSKDVLQTTDGGYIITGWTNSVGAGSNDVWLIRTNADGDTLWTKIIGGGSPDGSFSIQQTEDGGYIITGWTSSFGAGNGDVWLIKLDSESVTDLGNNERKPLKDYSLFQNYPNPFNPSTVIKYLIPQTSNVELKVFDILGNEIATLVSEEKPIGSYEVDFDASSLSSGIYFYRFQAGSFAETKKMILIK